MVEETGYTSRVRVQAAAPLPGVSAASTGAGVADAIGQAGAVIQQEKLEDARLDRQLRDNSEWSAAMVVDAEVRNRTQTFALEGRNSDEPGHAERVGKEIEAAREQLLGMVTSPRLKQQMEVRLADWGETLRAREANWEVLRGQEKVVENVEQTLRVLDGEARRAATPLEFDKVLKAYREGLAGLDLPDEVKGKLDVEVQQRAAVGFIRGMTDRDPAAARALIDSGAFDGMISGDQLDVLRNGAEAEIRRVEREREREQAEAVANVQAQINQLIQFEGLGIAQPVEAYDDAIQAAMAIGDTKLVTQLTALKNNNEFTREWSPSNATALQREQRMAALNRKNKRTQEEDMELAFLQKRAPGWASEEARDPVSQAMLRGGKGAPPVIDLNDGASWNDRAAWMNARDIASAFSGAELRELQEAAETPQGELQVMEQLDKVRDDFARFAMAQQIRPDDPTFHTMAMLRPAIRSTIRQGRKAIANNPKFFKDIDPDIETKMTQLDKQIAYALREFDDDHAAAVRDVYRQFLAGNAAAQGKLDFTDFEDGPGMDKSLRSAVAHALGGTYYTKNGKTALLGGFGTSNGRAFVLPDNMNQAEFDRRVQQQVAGSRNPPVNSDGSLANLFRATPVRMPDGFYEWETPGRQRVKAKAGGNFRVKGD